MFPANPWIRHELDVRRICPACHHIFNVTVRIVHTRGSMLHLGADCQPFIPCIGGPS